MIRPGTLRRALAALLLCTVAVSVAAQPPAEPTRNLKVLPKDIPREDLLKIMNGFTRALGVRCIYCHVGEEGKPFRPQDFPLDDKPTKLKARIMMRMTQDLNDKYLTTLEHRAVPAIQVQCVTCHRGAPLPRMLQDVLKSAYDTGGLDSSLARYRALRERSYGRFTYDFGEVPLVELANQVRDAGHADDAARLLAFNVEMNPTSAFAKRQHVVTAVAEAFTRSGADSGAATYHALKSRYGDAVISEGTLNEIGYQLLGAHAIEPAIAAFKLNTVEYPASANTWDSLGEAYETHGDRKLAIASYTHSLAIDPANANAKERLAALKGGASGKAKPKR